MFARLPPCACLYPAQLAGTISTVFRVLAGMHQLITRCTDDLTRNWIHLENQRFTVGKYPEIKRLQVRKEQEAEEIETGSKHGI